jgi:hypothetical protein
MPPPPTILRLAVADCQQRLCWLRVQPDCLRLSIHDRLAMTTTILCYEGVPSADSARLCAAAAVPIAAD